MTSPAPLTEAEQCVEATMLRHLTGVPIPDWTEAARAVVAAVRDQIATEARYAAADGLLALAPEQATADAKDAFWRAAAIVRANPLSLPASKETQQ